MRYPPHGTRSVGLARNTLGKDVLKHDPFCVVMVETVEGMRNLDAIAGIPGVDCILLGGADLACDMGLPAEQVFAPSPAPAIVEAIKQVAAACARHGKIAGNAAGDAAEVADMLVHGIRFIPISAATALLARAARAELGASRSALAQFAAKS